MTVFNVVVTVLKGETPLQGVQVFYQSPTAFGSALTDAYGQRNFTRTLATELPFKVWIDYEGIHYEETVETAMQDETIPITFQTAIPPPPIQLWKVLLILGVLAGASIIAIGVAKKKG